MRTMKEIQYAMKRLQRALIIAQSATPRQQPAAHRYVGRIASLNLGLQHGHDDRHHNELGEIALDQRIWQLSNKIRGFDPTLYSDAWRSAYHNF